MGLLSETETGVGGYYHGLWVHPVSQGSDGGCWEVSPVKMD